MTPDKLREILGLCKASASRIDELTEVQLKERDLARRFWYHTGCRVDFLINDTTDDDLLEMWALFVLEASEEMKWTSSRC